MKTTFKTTDSGLVILKEARSTIHGQKVLLTRKTTKGGNIRHGVILESRDGRRHQKIGTFKGIKDAWKLY